MPAGRWPVLPQQKIDKLLKRSGRLWIRRMRLLWPEERPKRPGESTPETPSRVAGQAVLALHGPEDFLRDVHLAGLLQPLETWRRIGLANAIAVRVEQDVDTRDIQPQDIRHTNGEVSHRLR